jgi:acetyl-CoA carboxylase biotin carboxyl carrier protein
VNLTQDDVQEILRLLDASSFEEMHLETERFKLTLRRSGSGGWTQERRTLSVPQSAAVTPAKEVALAAADTTAPATGDAGAIDSNAIEVRTPIVGTFFRAPKPGAAPFVEVGSSVMAETVIGIVETMKLMNSVHAGAAGEVVEIRTADGQFVEQGQVLMRLTRERA